LSDAGLGSKVAFVSNLISLMVYAMQWSMSCTYRPNRLGGCYNCAKPQNSLKDEKHVSLFNPLAVRHLELQVKYPCHYHRQD
jgi:hypothetical protein